MWGSPLGPSADAMASAEPDGPQPPRLLIVTVNYNSAEELARCVASLDRGSFDRWLVIDNASTADGETGRLERLAEHGVEVVRLPENTGFGAGVNAGVRELAPDADDLLWILNPDTVAAEGAPDRLASALAAEPDAILSPLILHADDDREWFGGGHLDARGLRVRHVPATRPSPAHLPFAPGTALAMRGRTWERLGGFSDELFMYWEDAELCIRAAAAGIPVRVERAAVIRHVEGASSSGAEGGRSELYYYYVNRNRSLVARMHRTTLPVRSRWRYALVTAGMLSTPLRRERVGRLRKLAAAVRGAVAGWRRPRR